MPYFNGLDKSLLKKYMKNNLLNYDLKTLTEWFAEMGERPFRAKQVMRWMHWGGAADFAEMTDLAKSLRAKLEEHACVGAPALMASQESRDGTRKWLLDVGTGNGVETVFIPESERGTLCISSQVGCALECTFCSTGRQGFNRNLTTAEIVGQLWWANKSLGRNAKRRARDFQCGHDGHGRSRWRITTMSSARCR